MMTDETTTDEKLPDYPDKDSRTFGYEVARTTMDAATGWVPGLGYAAGKIFEQFVQPPLQKRRDEWFQRLGENVREMQEQRESFDPGDLASNEDFISAVYEATQAAMKTSKEEKRRALTNGVMNIAAGMTIDEVLRGTFFGYIERFSPLHIRVLQLLSDPRSSSRMRHRAESIMSGGALDIYRVEIPREEVSDAIFKRVLSDLDREGLADTGGLSVMQTGSSLLDKRSTGIGDAFLRFISSPIEG